MSHHNCLTLWSTLWLQITQELTDMFPDASTADAALPADTAVRTPDFGMNADFANLTDTLLFTEL